jgi:hypothetical protein
VIAGPPVDIATVAAASPLAADGTEYARSTIRLACVHSSHTPPSTIATATDAPFLAPLRGIGKASIDSSPCIRLAVRTPVAGPNLQDIRALSLVTPSDRRGGSGRGDIMPRHAGWTTHQVRDRSRPGDGYRQSSARQASRYA